MRSENAEWYPYQNGATPDSVGSEGGEILRDEEHCMGARITLERGGSVAPFAITCGVYGWMMHTRFFATEAEAEEQFTRMQTSLHQLLLTACDAPGDSVMLQGLDDFIRNYP